MFLSSLLSASGQCYAFGSNQHGQLGTNSCRNSRVPHLVVGLQAMKVTVVACGDAFTVAIGAGEAEAPVSWAAAGPGFPLPAVHAVAKAGLGGSPGWYRGDGRPVCWCALGAARCIYPSADGEVCTWGKGARGRLGRKDEETGAPRPVQLEETHPYLVTSVACCHGNTLLAVKRE